MESLQKIKQRISSINSTKKITKAMELVATAKFSKIKNKVDSVRSYYKNIESIFLSLIKNTHQDIDKLLNKHAWKFASKRNLYIVFGSDLGLCGSFNSEMYKKICETVSGDDILIVVGSKLLSLIDKNKKYHIIQTLTQIGDNPTFEVAQVVANKIYDVLEISLLESVNLIYTYYENPLKADPIVKEIFPISKKTIEKYENENKSEYKEDIIFEPNPETILQNSFRIFFEASIFNALTNAKLAETSQRRTAMEQASDNAEDLINELKIKYNSSRQSKITQELTEIVNGAGS
ncbi:ATP synthase F1 subunit gamma [Metamycoplasma phocicerebrale]|uniref:ATP synthase gamma chain n=1 Tax=Metamycoplasma phocicerebrale TaxID=142649 RepID=A0A3Q9V9M6_9BACT|nr:ATP synthase F1 subunit gamma [Metamycoplasma phocicerebrale]AZZ65616.1 ATP synthase F1 subunit gamma [Metamycoplasma phocicerebrale]